MNEIDLKIVKYLALGMSQAHISCRLKKKAIMPNSVSTVEKRIRKIKGQHGAKTLFHLALILKRKGMLEEV